MSRKNALLSCAIGGAILVSCAAYVLYGPRSGDMNGKPDFADVDVAGKSSAQAVPSQPSTINVRGVRPSVQTGVPQPSAATSLTRPRHKMDTDLAQFAANFDELQSKAEAGDSGAAMALYEGLSLCSGTPLTRAGLEDSKSLLASQFGADSQEYARDAAFQEKRYRDCSTLGKDRIDGARNWLIRAAELGDSRAKLAFGAVGQPPTSETPVADFREYSAKAQQYLDEELRAHNPDALFAASRSYAPGGFQNTSTANQYAHLYAYALAVDLKQGAVFDQMVNLGDSLSPSDRAAAIAQAQAIYRACCLH